MEVTIESMLESDRAKQQKAELVKGLNQRLSALDTESGDLLDLSDYGDSDEDEEDEEEDDEEYYGDGKEAENGDGEQVRSE